MMKKVKKKPTVPKFIFHTDELLRKHRLLVKQQGWGKNAKMSLVDWKTYKPASAARQKRFWKEWDSENLFEPK